MNPEIQASSDVIKGHIEYLCLEDTASALLLLTKQQQIQFVCTLKLRTIDHFAFTAFLGKELWEALITPWSAFGRLALHCLQITMCPLCSAPVSYLPRLALASTFPFAPPLCEDSMSLAVSCSSMTSAWR